MSKKLAGPEDLKGVYVAIVTPFFNGEFDELSFRGLINFLLEQGIHGIVAVGTTGESPVLDYELHSKVIRVAIEEVAGRVPVIAGTGSNWTDETIMMSRDAVELGADGLLLVTPYYNKPSQEGLYRHYRKVAESVDGTAITLYNVPSRTGINMEPLTVKRLVEIPNIIGLKEAGTFSQAEEIIKLCPRLSVVTGNDSHFYDLLCRGGKGVISVGAQVIPASYVGLYNAVICRRDFIDAQRFDDHVQDVNKAMFPPGDPNPVGVKTALAMMKRIRSSELRLPLCEPSAENHRLITETLVRCGLVSF